MNKLTMVHEDIEYQISSKTEVPGSCHGCAFIAKRCPNIHNESFAFGRNCTTHNNTYEEVKFEIGPPPHIGYWYCKTTAKEYHPVPRKEWRFWNGFAWSIPIRSGASVAVAKSHAQLLALVAPAEISWSTAWPLDARVKRVDPGPDAEVIYD